MQPKWHLLFGIIFCFLVYLVFQVSFFNIILILFSSILIDLDHYFRYIIIKKNFNPKIFWNWSTKQNHDWSNLTTKERFEKYKIPMYAFHGIEFWLILIYLSLIFPILIWVLIGIAFHMFIDFIDSYYKNYPLYFKFSQIYIYLVNKRKKEINLI